ncbi:MAG: hydroxyisourate hydrolase [Porticoccaceae bacterium]|nr:hydroxyisourate hydrolase [Porticoccaceae bacterium]
MSGITTHILDTARGTPASNVAITLSKLEKDQWQPIGSGNTNDDGRITDLCKQQTVLSVGTYKMHFATKQYFSAVGDAVFYPYAEIVFVIDNIDQHYHIPLLLSPFGYSTYRGS